MDVLDETWCGLEVWAKRVEGDAKGWVDLLTATWTKGDSRALGAQHAAAGHLINAVLSLSSPVGEVGVDVHEVVPDDDHTRPLDLGPRRDSRRITDVEGVAKSVLLVRDGSIN